MMRRFNRLAWGAADAARPHGLLAAGMESGELALWDPTRILANDELAISISCHTYSLDAPPARQTHLL